jgi:hypothetical protein
MDGLNLYQQGFLRHVVQAASRFLIVGGQARHSFNGDYDLDIWFDAEDEANRQRTADAIKQWITRCHWHFHKGRAEEFLRWTFHNGSMLTIPEQVEGVLYAVDQSQVTRDNGLELIIGSKEKEPGFADLASRAVQRLAAP